MIPNLTLAQWARERVRSTAMARDEARAFSRPLWDEACAQGLFAPLGPSDMSWAERLRAFAANLYGMALGGVDIPFTFTAVAHALTIGTVERFGTQGQRDEHLPRLLAGAAIGAICNAEAAAGTDIRGLRSEASIDGDRVLLSADKGPVTNAPYADLLLLSAWTKDAERRLEIYLVGDPTQKYQRRVMSHAGMWTGTNGSVVLENVPCQRPTQCLGFNGSQGAAGVKAFKECFNLERLLVSVVVMGALEGLIEVGTDHINAREAFGAKIKSFQYVQEKLVKVYAAAETLHAVIDRTLAPDGAEPRNPLELDGKRLALLKLLASEDGYEASVAHMELYGAAGIAATHLAQKTVRDLMCLKALGGTKELQKNVIFAELDKPARPEEQALAAAKRAA